MANESLIVGNSNWAVKANNLLGYAVGETSGYYVPRELDFTRNSTATYTDENGIIQTAAANIARVQDNALLLEPQRTNLAFYSEQFDNASWTKLNSSITANTTTAPNGTLTADKLTATATTSTHILLQQPAGSVSGATSTVSIYVKSAGLSNIQFVNNAGGLGVANFNLSAETAVLLSGVSASIENVGNGWYRCIMTYTPTTSGNYNVQIRLADSSGNTTFLGNGTDGVFIWGAQLEQGSYPTSYIKTTNATATRLADSCSKTGISSLIGQSEGVLFAEVQGFSNDTARFAISDGTNNNNIYIELSASNISAVGRVGAVNQFSIVSSQTLTNVNKIAIKYKTNDFALYVNGVQVGTDTSGSTYSPNTLNTFRFDRGDGGIPFYGNVKQIIVFPTRLTNTQLAELTTL